MDEYDAYVVSRWICTELLPRLSSSYNQRAILEILKHAVIGIPMTYESLVLMDQDLAEHLKKLCAADHRIWEVIRVHDRQQGELPPGTS